MSANDHCLFCFRHRAAIECAKANNSSSLSDEQRIDNGILCSFGCAHEFLVSATQPKQVHKTNNNDVCRRCGLHKRNPASNTNGCQHTYVGEMEVFKKLVDTQVAAMKETKQVNIQKSSSNVLLKGLTSAEFGPITPSNNLIPFDIMAEGSIQKLPIATSDNKPLLKGVYKTYETIGLPLDILFECIKNKGAMISWYHFYREAYAAGMSHERILSKLEEAVSDVWGKTFCDTVIGWLNGKFGKRSV